MVVGKHDPNAAAASVLTPFMASDGVVGYGSPAASADSMFWSDPIRLNSPIGTITVRYLTHSDPWSGSSMSWTVRTGEWNAGGSAGNDPVTMPVAQAMAVPTPTATSPPGMPPLNRTR